jgi:hypothetical protein
MIHDSLIRQLPSSQTYDVSITMTGPQSVPVTFAGSFQLQNSVVSHVNVADPLSIDNPGGAFAFTTGVDSAGLISLQDYYRGTPGNSSSFYTLAFDLTGHDVYFSTDGNVTGTWACGQAASCTSAVHAAPEIGLIWAPVILLAGLLAVMRGSAKDR